MNGIFGIFRLDGKPVALSNIKIMRDAMSEHGHDGCSLLAEGAVGMGQTRFFSYPEARLENLPANDKERGVIFTARGRVDNRADLAGKLGIPSGPFHEIPDSEFIRQAYLKWGSDCAARIYGDWAFAAYNIKDKRLFLARDHHGVSSLYYYSDHRVFAFASSRKALLDLNLFPLEMDELFLAQVIVSWPAYHGERTIYKQIKRLPPSHSINVSVGKTDITRYWRLEETKELSLSGIEEYAESFREVFDEAVRCRLRAEGNVAVSMSGGLDSGSVAAAAGRLIGKEGKILHAFTSLPISNTNCYEGRSFGDERLFAEATARHTGNIELHPVYADDLTPVQGIRAMLNIYNEPCHAASNFFWMRSLRHLAVERGCRVLLTGACGNAGISWSGDIFSQPLHAQLNALGWKRWMKESTKRIMPTWLKSVYTNARNPKNERWMGTAIRPDFADRLNLFDRMLNDPDSLIASLRQSPLERRFRLLKPGRSILGALQAETGAATGIDVRDPTADLRVLAFTLSVPDRFFIDPKTGIDRFLIREAMRGRLPDMVRLNRRQGLQAADLVPRLRKSSPEVEEALDELAKGPAAEYIDISHMRSVWKMVQADDTPAAFKKSVTILTRGIMAGLFVNAFYSGRKS